MPASFDQKLLAASGFLVLGSLGACIIGATSTPSAAARTAPADITAVNRLNKGDQITATAVRQVQEKQVQEKQVQQQLPPSSGGVKTSLQRPPLGCDGAFSPVAEPARAGIYKRCTV
jgi:hypothetical protein